MSESIVVDEAPLQEEPITETQEEQRYMVDGLLSILVPTNEKIRLWIRENLTC